MSVSIKVAVRCRPFTIDDKLGVQLTQTGEEEGEIDVLNSTYSTTRFAFTYAWWSAFGFSRHVQSNDDEAGAMELVDQQKVYLSVGKKIKADLLGGNAVVLFAYGLSGSGKTFTVFGPDAVDEPEAWFKHGEPHPLWGIFPRLAYEVFQEKEDGWKITMKYFQNVVETVRDLMSPVGKEMHYKNGMKKDADGFTDIEWSSSAVLNSWDDLRKAFRAANARKAIAPTQFNHQSTRGHCIMTLEVEMPHPEMPGMKRRGRVYVCDLAGTEPAGDIVFARYEKKVFESGDIEHTYLGPHQDMRKTKELQDQGKKINLSLSEMAQFFMKMAEAVQQGTLKPGGTIPGCNSYFLCKYLKDTMLQARTYLFCAIRPEVTYHRYTFSTLGFAKNASVVKLKPKMATVQATPAERKLMEELEQMKALVAQLQQQRLHLAPTSLQDEEEKNGRGTCASPADTVEATGEDVRDSSEGEAGEDQAGSAKTDGNGLVDGEQGRQESGKYGQTDIEASEASQATAAAAAAAEAAAAKADSGDANEELRKRRESMARNAERVSQLQQMLEAKQMQLREVLSGGGEGKKGPTQEERQLEQQRDEYGRRGISLSHFEADTPLPHLINVDEDPFRHNRFVYLLKKPVTVFGPRCDVQPMSLSVQRKHCSVEVKREKGHKGGTVTLIGGRGEVFHNGKKMRKQEQVELSPYDRVAIGGELLLFRWKALITADTCPPPGAEEAVMEFKKAIQARSGRRRSAELHAMEQQLKDLQSEKAKAEAAAKLAASEKAGKDIQEQQELLPEAGIGLLSLPDALDDERIAKIIRSAEDEVQTLLPTVKEAEQFMQIFGRDYLAFDVNLQRSQEGEAFEVAASVHVKNTRTGQSCYVSSFEFLEHHSIFSDEVAQLRAALDNGREYEVPAEHDPSYLLLQGIHQLGVATIFTEPIVYMMATEDEERFTVIKNVRAPYGEVGKLEATWYPLMLNAEGTPVEPEGPDASDAELPEIDSPKDLIDMPWAYRFEITAASGLPLLCGSAYCQYDFLGETFTSETVQPGPPSAAPVFGYSFIHRVDKVTEEVVTQLCEPLNVCLYVGPHVEPEKPENAISAQNPVVHARFEALTRTNSLGPVTPPAGSMRHGSRLLAPSGTGIGSKTSPARPQDKILPQAQHSVNGDGDGTVDAVMSLSSWGFAPPSTGRVIDAAGSTYGDQGEDGVPRGETSAAECAALREENSTLRKELAEARAVIARLRESAGGGGGSAEAGGGGGGIAASASDGALPQSSRGSKNNSSSEKHDAEGDMPSPGSGRSRRGRKSVAERESGDGRRRDKDSRSRKKVEIDAARVTDAAVEAVTITGGEDEESKVEGIGSPTDEESRQRPSEQGKCRSASTTGRRSRTSSPDVPEHPQQD